MKKVYYSIFALLGIILVSCSGSATYRGNWKGMTPDGQRADIVFQAKELIIADTAGQTGTFGYTQNSVNITNGVETYGIALDDGRTYSIKFPIANDESMGVLLDGNGNVLYAIGRKDYIQPGDMYKLR